MNQFYFFRVMRLLVFFLTVGFMQLSAATYSQTVTLQVRSRQLSEVLQSIKAQTGYYYLFTKQMAREAKPVTLNMKQIPLEEALEQLFKDQPFDYSIEGKVISIRPRLSSLSKQNPSTRTRDVTYQPRNMPTIMDSEIYVKVIDSLGQPIVGANIAVKGTNKRAVTGRNGVFAISVNPRDVLIVSSVGFVSFECRLSDELQPQQIEGQRGMIAVRSFPSEDGQIGDSRPRYFSSSMNEPAFMIRLQESNSPLDEVSVIAYGTASQRYSAGSVAIITREQLEKQPVTNFALALEGQVPGLLVTPTSGAPGSAVKIQIRGQNSIRSDASSGNIPFDQPLFIIDGVPFAPQNNNVNQFSSLGGSSGYGNQIPVGYSANYTGLSPLNALNPNDIESISFLKDADATSIYGSQGSNGVVLITTRKGKPGKISLSADINSGVNFNSRPIAMLNLAQYLDYRREALVNDGIDLSTASPSQFPDLLIFDQNKNTDWFRTFEKNSSATTNAHLSLSGGTEYSNFILSTGYTDAGFNFPGDFSDKRLTTHAAYHVSTLDNRFNADFSTDFTYGRNNSTGSPNVTKGILLPPNYPDLIDPQGNLVWNYEGIDLSSNQFFAYLKTASSLKSVNLNNSLRLSYRVMDGLMASVNLGYNRMTTDESSKNPAAAQSPQYRSSSAQFSASTFETLNMEPQLNYSHQFDQSKLDLLLGGTYKSNLSATSITQGYNYPNDALLDAITAAETILASNERNPYKYVGIFGRIGYVHKQRYILSLTGRRDGSSNFGPGRRFGNFGSVGLGWIFSEEGSIKEALPFLSYGKLSGSYGTTGSDGVAPYRYQAYWEVIPQVLRFQNIAPYRPLNLYNPDYSWGSKRAFNVGLALGFLEDRFLLTTNWYNNRTAHGLISYALPIQTGFNTVVTNVDQTVQNQGWEFQLTTKNISNEVFSWNSTFNLTLNRNKLIRFPGLEESPYANSYIIGKSVNTVFGYQYKGVNPETGLYEFLDGKGNVTNSPVYEMAANGGDLVPIANLDPRFFGLFGNTFRYKNLDLTVNLQFSKQIGLNYLGSLNSQQAVPGSMTNVPAVLLDGLWRQPGDLATVQKLTTGVNFGEANLSATNFYQSSGAYSDASYIRLKTVSANYRLPASWFSGRDIKGISLYLSAQNLLTFTKYEVGDPETPGGLLNFPLQRIVTFGLKVNM